MDDDGIQTPYAGRAWGRNPVHLDLWNSGQTQAWRARWICRTWNSLNLPGMPVKWSLPSPILSTPSPFRSWTPRWIRAYWYAFFHANCSWGISKPQPNTFTPGTTGRTTRWIINVYTGLRSGAFEDFVHVPTFDAGSLIQQSTMERRHWLVDRHPVGLGPHRTTSAKLTSISANTVGDMVGDVSSPGRRWPESNQPHVW